MNKTIQHAIGALTAFLLCAGTAKTAYASEGQEYITISVEAEDNSGTLLYALDSDAPEDFSPSNEFSIPAGTNHTIYVKDSAGNISSQEYISSPEDYETYAGGEEKERAVDIDIILDDSKDEEPDYSNYEYAGDLLSDPAEAGQGTVHEKVEASAYDPDAERIFYTVTTDEGEVFYLVIDQGQSTNNVYLLDQVKVSDLRALAIDDSGKSESSESTSLLSALNGGAENSEDKLVSEEEPAAPQKKSMGGNLIILLLLAAAGGGFYYYKNVYKNKKDEQMDLIDALDKEDFEAEETEDDEVDFGLDDDYQERLMQELMEEDEPDDDEENYLTGEGTFSQESDSGAVTGFPEESHSAPYETDERDDDLDAPEEEED
ncbi:MAG: DUF4366 domain-containing protein [Lachnospiraceae bacterium]|nr:DUF4366 domain-containing protein [Lachnospiraceae bacterium]